jgi:murein DD-endopeptidase MepM/ murein hydrolase activator NlpD
MTHRAGTQWVAVVGIALSAASGRHWLLLKEKGKRDKSIPFRVRAKKYETQHITLKDSRRVDPSGSDLQRIQREQEEIGAALAHWRQVDAVAYPMTLPVSGRISGSFGLRRYFNGQPRKPHSGLDIAAPSGTPVGAAQKGRVIATGDYFFNGKAILIDHGDGLVSMYCHLDRIDVIPDQEVAKGVPIGAVGKTGRATGPHLHWGISLNGAMVDPRLFLAETMLSQPEPEN